MSAIGRRVVFSIDAESVGLYGGHFAVGYIVVDFETKQELESGYFSCPFEEANGTEDNERWVKANVVPHLPTKEYECKNPEEVAEKVYSIWMKVKETYGKDNVEAIVDWGYPVEARLFVNATIKDVDGREWNGPAPLHEVSTALKFAGISPEAHPRNENELPEHHPVNDARYSVRLYLMAWDKTKPVRE